MNYNVQYFLEQCLLSLREVIVAEDSEVIVVDNNSTDHSCQMIRKKFPEVLLLENKSNLGLAKANNKGVGVSSGKFLCFLNPDTIIPDNVFPNLLKKATQLPHVGLVGPRLISGKGNFLRESKRNIPAPLTSLKRLLGIRTRFVKSYFADHIQEREIGRVDVLDSAFMLIKKNHYLSVGGFDDDYFLYGEDLDLSYRVKKMGLLNYYLGTITALHYKGESVDRNADLVMIFYGAMRLFYSKHFKSNRVLDFMVSVGIRMVSFIHSFKDFKKNRREVTQYYLISENEVLSANIASKLNTELIRVSTIEREDLGDKNIEIIFDGDFMSYLEIIKQMELLNKRNVTFKIRPADCDYILGSDFSDGKGEVITF